MQTLFDDVLSDLDDGEKIEFPIYSPDDIASAAFDYYRRTGFPYRDLPLHVCQQELNRLAAMPINDKLLQNNVCYQVADTYHRHRFHAAATGKHAPFDSFHDDRRLRIAIDLVMESTSRIGTGYFGTLSLVRGTQACSNFRPAFAKYLYGTYAKTGATVLDTSTGYGGRLLGYLGTQLNGRYIGIDPNVETHAANTRMAYELGFEEQVELINLPAEDVDPETLRERCDFAFTSPPYWGKERYSYDDTQSWVRYSGAEEWRDKFLAKMIQLQYAALRPGSYNIVNIAPVKIGKVTAPLDEWTIECGQKAGFKYLETRKFMLSSRFGANLDNDVAFEPLIIFRKEE